MRFRLRTLLIVLALGPPLIWGGWWAWEWFGPKPPPTREELNAMFEELERTGATKGGRP